MQNLAAPAAWQAVTAGQARLTLAAAGSALRMDYDFNGAGGFVVARLPLQQTLSPDYVLRLKLRGRGPLNDFEIKLVDASGLNVWRHVIRPLRVTSRWRQIELFSRDFDFAWGPASGAPLRDLGALELAICAGEGGTGHLEIDALTLHDIELPAPQLRASSGAPSLEGETVCWQPEVEDARPWLVYDAGARRDVGGLVIDWDRHAPVAGFIVSVSADGRRWRRRYVCAAAGGARSYVALPDCRTRWLRLQCKQPVGALRMALQGEAFSRSPGAFCQAVALAEPRGALPRWLRREQSLWTPVGNDEGRGCALINEEGMVELAPGSCSLEPMIYDNGQLLDWAAVNRRQQLHDGWRPPASVAWQHDHWRLQIEPVMALGGVLRLHYQLINQCPTPRQVRLLFLLRPFQVTPPWQHYRDYGGLAPIHHVALVDRTVIVNQGLRLQPDDGAFRFGAMGFDQGQLVETLRRGELPRSSAVHDAQGLASAVIAFDISLAAGAQQALAITVTRDEAAAVAPHAAASFDWRQRLPTTQWQAPGDAGVAIATALTATAHLLMLRDGPALQAGARRYTRAWIRDATTICAALLRMRCSEPVAAFIRWYAGYQNADGSIPCCVDQHGADPLVEHDSHGQWLSLLADYTRLTGDVTLLQAHWSSLRRTVDAIAALLEPSGLLPVSVSHEGYLAQPVHAYWDDAWMLRGLRDAAEMAQRLHHPEEARRYQAMAQQAEIALVRSISATRAEHQLDFLPGSIEWADYDPSATANAVVLLDAAAGLDRAALEHTYRRYLDDWRRKRRGELSWSNYSAYEIRIVGALLRLGWRDEALELLRFFLGERRPLGWNQWPEITWRDPQAPAHIGDVPHAWIAAEYVIALRSLFAYESETADALVLAAGVAPAWLVGDGVRVEAMPTAVGALSYTLRQTADRELQGEIGSGVRGRLVLRPPLAAPIAAVQVNGRPHADFDATSVTLEAAPAVVTITLAHRDST